MACDGQGWLGEEINHEAHEEHEEDKAEIQPNLELAPGRFDDLKFCPVNTEGRIAKLDHNHRVGCDFSALILRALRELRGLSIS